MKLFYALVLGCACLVSTPTIEASPVDANSQNSSINFAVAYNNSTQTGIGPNGVVRLTVLGNHEGNFKLSNNGGIIVPAKGTYEISYRVLTSAPASLALFNNQNLIDASAFGSLSVTTPISGSTIVDLRARDEITIRSIENTKAFNTIIPAGSIAPTLAVNFTIKYIENK